MTAIVNKEARRKLIDALGNLYWVFAGYKPENEIPACSHCVDADDKNRLVSKSLRELTADDLSQYAFKALTTFGNVDTFRHFLPRILETIARGPGLPIDTQIFFGKLEYGRWHEWPEDERSAVERFLVAWWDDTILSHPSTEHVDVCLCCIGRTLDDVRPFLEKFDRACQTSQVAQRQMAQLYIDLGPDWSDEGSLGPFWGERSNQEGQVLAWLRDPLHISIVEQALAEFKDDYQLQELLSWSIRQLREDAEESPD